MNLKTLHIVSGEDIENDGTRSLGEALDNLLGVASSDYGLVLVSQLFVVYLEVE